VTPRDYITEWRAHAPWVEDFKVEQNLVISRALFAIFSHPALGNPLFSAAGLHSISCISNLQLVIPRTSISSKSALSPPARSWAPCARCSIRGLTNRNGGRPRDASPLSTDSTPTPQTRIQPLSSTGNTASGRWASKKLQDVRWWHALLTYIVIGGGLSLLLSLCSHR
jgi:hypothetical protein